ncbi:Ubiquitin recognition factor in ER-associated degradation protein 1, partial [Linum grandiflorum]
SPSSSLSSRAARQPPISSSDDDCDPTVDSIPPLRFALQVCFRVISNSAERMDRHETSSATFEQFYRCYPVAFLDKPHLEKGNKVIMPPSALERLAKLHIDYPMLFELHNPSVKRVTHCGVLEFVADEGLIYLPYWMMENMLLEEGDLVQMRNASLEKGTYVKLQPHSKDFLDVANPKAILETSLRNYSCLTTGDTIMVAYNNKKFYINIVEAKPSSAVSIVETDCEVDFAPPLDYKEPEKPVASALKKPNKRPAEVDQEEPPLKKKKLDPFTGSARRLDGKESTEPAAALTTTCTVKQCQTIEAKEEDRNDTKSSARRPGKLMFGANKNRPVDETTSTTLKKESEKEVQKQEQEPKFQAFTGKKYSLKD